MKAMTYARLGLVGLLLGLFTGVADAGDKAGGLSPELINDIRSSFKMDQQTRVLYNSITNNSIDDLVLNRDVLRHHDDHFSHRIKMENITDQQHTGRCWMFAGLNTMRPAVMRKAKLDKFEFSAAYLAFWDKMEKSNLYLEYMIELRDRDFLDRQWELVHEWTLGDGGWWNYVVALVRKYGVVPKDVMPETASSNNTRVLNEVLERKLRVDAAAMHKAYHHGASVQKLRAMKKKALAQVYRILVLNYGQPPTEFEWRYEPKHDEDEKNEDKKADKKAEDAGVKKVVSITRRYTPKSFYDQFVGVKLEDFVCLYNDPNNAYGKHYQFKSARNMADARDMDFVNIDMDAMKTIAMQSIIANEPVWFACDVGKDQSKKLGIMADRLYDYGPLFDADLKMTKAERVRYRVGASNHAMVFMGVDVKDGKPVKWLVENSWGDDEGNKGTWTMYNGWFNQNVYTIIVNKRHVPAPIMNAFDQPAKVLPPWYPGALGVR